MDIKKGKKVYKFFGSIIKNILVKTFVILGIVGILGVLLAGLLFLFIHLDDLIARREGHVGWDDPCYKSYVVEKGPIYEIKNERVCMEFKRGATRAYIKTLKEADVQTFHKIDFYYFADKKHVYYRDKIVKGVDPKHFKSIGVHSGYFTDGKNIYHNGEIINNNVENFTMTLNN